MYHSPWFVAARAYVEARRATWYILSAKYGLVEPTETIDPYEYTLNNAPITERQRWAMLVLDGLHDRLVSGDEVVFFAGKRYREFLEAPLQGRGIKVRVPMSALRQGEQVSWLQSHHYDSP